MIATKPLVLIVEDDYLIAKELACMIEGLGASAMGPAPDVATALKLIGSGAKPDIAVLDINLNDELVFPVADELARLGIAFMFASGSKAEAVPEAHRDRPFCEKPVSDRALAAFLHVALPSSSTLRKAAKLRLRRS